MTKAPDIVCAPLLGHEFRWLRRTSGFTFRQLSIFSEGWSAEASPGVRSTNYFWELEQRPHVRVPEWVSLMMERMLGTLRYAALRSQYLHSDDHADIEHERKALQAQRTARRHAQTNRLSPPPQHAGSTAAVAHHPAADNESNGDA